MSIDTSRGRHAMTSRKNIARITASVAVTGGLVAGMAATGTSGASSATPAPQAHPAAAKSAPQAQAPKKDTAATPTKHATKAQTVSRSAARRAVSAAPKAPTQAAAAKAAPHKAATKTAPHKAAKPVTTAVHKAKADASTPKAPAVTAQAKTTSTTRQASAAQSSGNVSGVLAAAQRYSGIPYVWGGSSASGADCSGYVAMVYRSVGKSLPHNSSAMQAATKRVSTPKPGDLVFTPGHVAIYAGNGQAYQALHPGTTSGKHPIYGSGVSYGRV